MNQIKKSDINNQAPRLNRTEIEYYNDKDEANERYNELLKLPEVHSLFIDPVKNHKGYWTITFERYPKY